MTAEIPSRSGPRDVGRDPDGRRSDRGTVRSLVGNTGANPGLSRNCDQGANPHDATAERLEGGGEHRSGSQDTAEPSTTTRMEMPR